VTFGTFILGEGTLRLPCAEILLGHKLLHMNAMPVFIIPIKREKIARTEGAVAGV
jgi:hypothetical protein